MSLRVIDPALSLPKPEAIETLSQPALLAAWLAKFLELQPTYDVQSIEADPGPAIAEATSFMRVIDRARINDAYRALRLALAQGNDLVGQAADRGVARLTYVPADIRNAIPAVLEPYDVLRLRTWLKMQTWGLGSPRGIEYEARTCGLDDVADARCYEIPGTGRMRLVLLPNAGRTASFDPVLTRVSAFVTDRRRRRGNSVVTVSVAEVRPIDVSATLFIRPGASPAAIVANATTAVTALMARRRRIALGVSAPHIAGALIVADVVKARVSPSVDQPIADDEAAELGRLSIAAEVFDG